MFSKAFSESKDTVWTKIMDKYVQKSLCLNKNVGKSGFPRTARTEADIGMVRRALEGTFSNNDC